MAKKNGKKKKAKKKDKTDDALYLEYKVEDDNMVDSSEMDSDQEDAYEEYEDRTWKADARIYKEGTLYESRKRVPRDRKSVDIEHLVSEFNKAWKNKKGRKRIREEYNKAAAIIGTRGEHYRDAFANPRDLPRVDANFFRMFQLIQRFIEDEKGRERQRKREKNMMREELADLRKAVWRYRAWHSSNTNTFKNTNKHTYQELARIADKHYIYYLSSEDSEDEEKSDQERDMRMEIRAERKKHQYLNGSSKGSNSSGKTKNISIENVNNASDSEAAPKKSPKTPKKKKKLRVVKKKTPVPQANSTTTTTTTTTTKKKKKKKKADSSSSESSGNEESSSEESSDEDEDAFPSLKDQPGFKKANTKQNAQDLMSDSDDDDDDVVKCAICKQSVPPVKHQCKTCGDVPIHYRCSENHCDDEQYQFKNAATKKKITGSCYDCITEWANQKTSNASSEPPSKKQKMTVEIPEHYMEIIVNDKDGNSYKEHCDPKPKSDAKNLIGQQFITTHEDDDGSDYEVMAHIIGKGVEKGKKHHYVMRYINPPQEWSDEYITGKSAAHNVAIYKRE